MTATPSIPSAPTPRRFVTIVYEIVDEAEWGKENPLRYEHHGLKACGVSIGDLMGLLEEVEPLLPATTYQHLYDKHVITSLPNP